MCAKSKLPAKRTLSNVKEEGREYRQDYQLLNLVLDFASDKIFIKDKSLRYLLGNRSFCNLLNRNHRDVVNKLDCDIFSGDDVERIRRADLEALQNGRPVTIQGLRLGNIIRSGYVIDYRAQRLDDVWHGGPVLVGSVEERREIPSRAVSEEERIVEDGGREMSERREENRILTESISRRLLQKIKQIDNVSRLRERLAKCPDISSSLDLILQVTMSDLDMDMGAVFAVSKDGKAAILRAVQSTIGEIQLKERYALDEEFLEFEAMREGECVSRVVEQDTHSILGLASAHCAPIHWAGAVRGMLSLASRKKTMLDTSDLAILGLYAEATSTVLERKRLTIMPEKERSRDTARLYELEFGNVYVIKDEVYRAFEIFVDNVLSGIEGLCVTRQFPPKIRKVWGLERTPIVWLTEETAEGFNTIYSLQDLSILVVDFLEKAKKGIVLLDGIEYLITNHGFGPFIRFLQLTRSRVEKREGILIAPLIGEALGVNEIRLIEREMTSLS